MKISDIEFQGDGKLEILGTIKALGSSLAPITFTGQALHIVFTNTGENQSQFSYSQFDANQGSKGIIDVNQSSVQFNNSSFKGLKQALGLRNNSKASINHSEFIENQLGLLVEDGAIALDDVNFVANQVAWQVSGRQELTSNALNFEDNDIHIRANKDITISHGIFNDSDYESLLSKLDGPIKVDFSQVADKHNLLDSWLKERWVELLTAANSGLWQDTFEALQLIRAHKSNARIEAFYQTLKLVTGQSIDQSNEFIHAVQRFNKNNEKGKLWVQAVKLPYTANTANSDAYIKNQALKKLTRDYLKDNFSGLKSAQIRKYKRKIAIEKHAIDSQVVYTMKKGLFLNVWVAHYLDMAKINRSLTTQGLIQRQNSELVVGLLSQADIFELEEQLIQSLKKQGIKYISLGTGSYGKPVQQRAQKMGANVVLETQVISDESKSGISKSLKMADVNLVVDLYDVENNATLDHLTASANKAGFKVREIVKKAVVESYGTIESKLMSALWQADEIVTEHKKERLKQQRIAKAKAERERKAKAEAERKRLAKLAREKAAKEKAAREKAQREQAAKEEAARIAAAKQAAQLEAQKQQQAKAKAEQQAQALQKVKQQIATTPDNEQNNEQQTPPPVQQNAATADIKPH